jgi:hypothetical protein
MKEDSQIFTQKRRSINTIIQKKTNKTTNSLAYSKDQDPLSSLSPSFYSISSSLSL